MKTAIAIASLVVYSDPYGGVSPAIVNRVNDDGTVDLTEFPLSGHGVVRRAVVHGFEISQWRALDEVPPTQEVISASAKKMAAAQTKVTEASAELDSVTAQAANGKAEPAAVKTAQKKLSDAQVAARKAEADHVKVKAGVMADGDTAKTETINYADGSSATGVATLPRINPTGSPAVPATPTVG